MFLKSIHGHGPDGVACRYLGRALGVPNQNKNESLLTGVQALRAE